MKNKILVLFLLFFIIGGVFAADSITINSGEARTSNTSISLQLVLDADSNICVNYSDSNSGCTWTPVLTGTHDETSTLIGEDGEKIISLHIERNNIYSKVTDSIILDTTSPTIIIENISDGNYYYTNRINVTITLDDDSGIDSNSYQLNNQKFVLTSSPQTINMDFNEGTNTLTVDANDILGNKSTQTISFIVDTIAPQISSLTTGTNYTNNETPTFNITKIETNPSKWYFSCNNDDTWTEITHTSDSVNTFNITTGNDCNTSDGTKTIYVKLEDKVGKISNISQVDVKYDNTLPSAPTGLSIESGNTEIILSWSAPTADNLSGNKEYKVYKNGEFYATTSNTNKTITGLTNGTSYAFKVTTIDNAGNESAFSSTINGTPQSCSCDLTIKRNGTSIENAKTGDNLLISCSWEEDVDDARIKYRYYDSGWETTQNLSDEEDDTSYIEENFSVSGNNERIEFQCIAKNVETKTKTIYIDNESPTIQWNSIDSTLKETKEISATITDNRTIKTVEFELNGVKYNSMKSGTKYYFNLDTTKIVNGTHLLKVTAIDEAGNQASKTINITIENTLTEEQQILKAINDAKARKIIVEDLIKYYSDRGLKLDNNLLSEKERADNLLKEAEQIINNNSKTKADEAKTIYNNINASIVFSNVGSDDYNFEKDNIGFYFSGTGLTQEQLEQAKNNILNGNATRKLSIIKIGEAYKVQIEISFNLEGQDYKIIEIIPKELVDSASKIFSNIEFSIIEDDPIIEFIVPRETTKIYYSFDVSEEKANDILESNLINEYKSPPIIINADEKVELSRADWTIIIVIIVILLIVIIGIVGIVVVGKKNGLGKNNPVEKVKSKLFKPKEKRVNWKYKK